MATGNGNQSGLSPIETTSAPGADEVVIDLLAVPAPPPRVVLPLCITWSYRGHRVVCTPLYDDAGTIVNFTWQCPICRRQQEFAFGLSVDLPKSGRLTLHGYVRCVDRACLLLVEVDAGEAVSAVGWW